MGNKTTEVDFYDCSKILAAYVNAVGCLHAVKTLHESIFLGYS